MMEGGWESKSTYTFYLELITDVLHLFVYVIFFVIVFTNYGLPLHLVSPVHFDLAQHCSVTVNPNSVLES
jgi:E3 ubiquitin-protein ligase synoviolin